MSIPAETINMSPGISTNIFWVTLCLWISASVTAFDSMSCDHVSVGAGPAGAYHAWRVATAPETASGTTICIFEMLGRAGGRVASMTHVGPKGDLVVEPGAYRFAPKKFCIDLPTGLHVCLWTPIVAGVIDNALKLHSKRYNMNPHDFDHDLYKIVDASGNDAGFAQYVWGMLSQAESVAVTGKVQLATFFEHTLESIEVANDTITKEAGNTEKAPVVLNLRDFKGNGIRVEAAKSVLLNLPQLPLMRVLAASGKTVAGMPPRQLHEPNPAVYMKLYLHYSDAWWRGGRYAGLNLTHGRFSNLQNVSRTLHPGVDTMHIFPGIQSPAPLQGSYHDGDFRCDEGKCRGYIQAHYSDDLFALMFYRSFGLLRFGEPTTNVTRSSHGAAGAWLLDEVHAALVEMHADLLGPDVARQVLTGEMTQPDHAVLSIWDPNAPGFGAACHFSRLTRNSSTKDTALSVARHTLQPFLASAGEERVFVASEAFAPLQCWSEGALQMAENALMRLGLSRPAWMTEDVYNEILFSDAEKAEEKEEKKRQGFASRHSMPPQFALGVPSNLMRPEGTQVTFV